MSNKVIIDLEMTTDYSADNNLWVDNDRIYEISLIETDENYNLTGRSFTSLINPEKSIKDPEDGKFRHRHSDEDVADKPTFAAIAKDVIDFIGDSDIVFTCWTFDPDGKLFCATVDNIKEPEGSFTADSAFLNKELEHAGFKSFSESRFINIRRIFEAVNGSERAGLKHAVADCGFTQDQFGEKHTAEADARALCAVIPYMIKKLDDKKSNLSVNKKSALNFNL